MRRAAFILIILSLLILIFTGTAAAQTATLRLNGNANDICDPGVADITVDLSSISDPISGAFFAIQYDQTKLSATTSSILTATCNNTLGVCMFGTNYFNPGISADTTVATITFTNIGLSLSETTNLVYDDTMLFTTGQAANTPVTMDTESPAFTFGPCVTTAIGGLLNLQGEVGAAAPFLTATAVLLGMSGLALLLVQRRKEERPA